MAFTRLMHASSACIWIQHKPFVRSKVCTVCLGAVNSHLLCPILQLLCLTAAVLQVPGHNRLILLLHPALVGCCCPQAVQLSLQGSLLSQQPAGHPASKPSELSAGASSFGAQLLAFVEDSSFCYKEAFSVSSLCLYGEGGSKPVLKVLVLTTFVLHNSLSADIVLPSTL